MTFLVDFMGRNGHKISTDTMFFNRLTGTPTTIGGRAASIINSNKDLQWTEITPPTHQRVELR